MLLFAVISVVGSRSTIRQSLMSSIFGESGLSSEVDVVSFDASVERLRQSVLVTAPEEFRQYFERRLVGLLRGNVVAGRNTWTNNNCESLNHVLKSYVQWRPQQLPDLVDTIRQIVVSQYNEADRALIGRGDMQLRPEYVKHRQTLDAWKSMSDGQRKKATDACFRLPAAPCVTSTDGQLTVPSTPGAGKKPHQRKRARSERTTTIVKKKHCGQHISS